MNLPQFTAESSLYRTSAHYNTVAPQASRTHVQPQTETGGGGRGGGGQPWCPFMNWLCGLCVTICDLIPAEGCIRICDFPCLYCRE